MNKAVIDTKIFSAYSTKHASVSSAHNKGLDVATIRRTTNWSEKSKVFARFYNRPIQVSNDNYACVVFNSK